MFHHWGKLMTFESVPRSYEKSRAWHRRAELRRLRSVSEVQTRAQRVVVVVVVVKGNTLQERQAKTDLPTYRIEYRV